MLNKVKPRTDGSYDGEYDAVAPTTELAPRYVKALVVVHHTRKRDPKASSGTSGSVDEALGSTALAGAFDIVVGLMRQMDLLKVEHESRLFEAMWCGSRLADERLTLISHSEMSQIELEHAAPLQSQIIRVVSQKKAPLKRRLRRSLALACQM